MLSFPENCKDCVFIHRSIDRSKKEVKFSGLTYIDILDDADVLVGGKTRADRDNITEVLFTIAWLTFPSLPLSAVRE